MCRRYLHAAQAAERFLPTLHFSLPRTAILEKLRGDGTLEP